MIDTDGLKARISLAEVVERHGIELKRDGTVNKALCPFHKETTPSFTVYDDDGGFYCFGCGASGSDSIAFIQEYLNKDFIEAAKYLGDMINFNIETDEPPGPKKPPAEPKPKQWVFTPPPGDQPPPTEIHRMVDGKWVNYPVVAAWAYRNIDSELQGYTLRIEPHPGKKEIIPYTYQTNTTSGESKWRQGSLPEPRVLYGSEYLTNADAVVLLVEGEKAADAARRLVGSDKLIVMTWPGGGKAVKKADWSLLEGRRVICWPDADAQTERDSAELLPLDKQPGYAAMIAVANQPGLMAKIVRVPTDVPDGWDLADAEQDGWTRDDVRNYYRENLCTVADLLPSEEPPLYDGPEPDHDYDETPYEYLPADYPPDAPQPVDKGIFDDGVVKFLGFNNSKAYYLPHGFRQVVEMSVGQHTKLQLLGIAPKHYWEAYFPSSKRNNDGVDWDMAADSFLRRSQAKGVFNSRLIRGRGAWFDDGRSVVHAGDRLVVDGQQVGLNEIDSRFIYPMADATSVTMADPMPPSEAKRFAQICDAIQWEESIFGRLLAGWCFLAPICGAIDWRPHIWLTGGAGTGKSTVMNRVMKPVLGDNHIFAAGDSTEAGLRMRLRQDAFPVIFDEFDSEREKAAKRTEDVLALITQSSTDTGAEIIKGGAGGKDDSYKIRSMFAFASIAVNIRNEAHESRLCVMTLKKPKPGEKNSPERLEHFRRLEAMIQSTLTDEYIKRLQARAIKLIPVIRKNIKTFSEAAALSPALGGMRLGDQVGALLAGSYGLFSNGEITKEDAVKWIDAQNWGSVNTASDAADDKNCLDLILTEPVRVEGVSKVRTMTVAEMIEMSARYVGGDADIGYEHTDATLARMGIKVRDTLQGEKQVVIASRHKALSRVLKDTPFEVSYARTIGRIDGAQKTGTERFAAVTSKAVALPIDRVIDRTEYLV